MIPLWCAVAIAIVMAVALIIWTRLSVAENEITANDGRQTIVFWGAHFLGEDIYAVINRFEREHLDPKTNKPKYRVILGTAVSPDITGDAQRLLCAVAGGVPPDVVWFDRFAIGEWAGRDALTDLTPYLEAQPKDDPLRIEIADYYQWAVDETSYTRPGTNDKPGIFGITTSVDLRVLFSNADLLRQEGFVDPQTKEPRPPRDWDELRHYANALTRYKRPGDKSSGITRLGFGPNFGNSWLYMYAWQAGGELMNKSPLVEKLPDGSTKTWPALTKVTLDNPPVVRALQYMTDVYDDLGGFKQVDAFQQGFQPGNLDAFLKGQVAMKIDGAWSMTTIADWKRDMDFIISPAPMPADRVAAGIKPITWGGGFALVVPKTAHNKDGAWRLIQYLSSRDVLLRLEQGKRELKESEGRIYLPTGLGNRKIFEELIDTYVTKNPKMPRRFREAYSVFTDMMPRTLYRPVTPVGQLLWNQHVSAYSKAVSHKNAAEAKAAGMDEARYCLIEGQAPVQRMLDEILAPLPAQSQVNWRPYFIAYGLLLCVPFALMYVVYRRRRVEYSYKPREVLSALMFASPWMIGFAVFVGGPILFSIVFAFTRYSVIVPAHYVGLENFRQILSDPLFAQALGNTAFMLLRIPLTMAASLAIALLLNNAIKGMSFYRTACYMPAIVPAVAVALLWVWMLNPSQGAINAALNWIFDTRVFDWLESLISRIGSYSADKPFHFTAPLWLQDESWSKPSLILMSLWSAGGGMIIWLAGLQSIPDQLYEAAAIDGAGPWKRFCHVTVPMLSPYIFFNLIIGVIGTMQIFGEAFIMTRGGPVDSTLFYAYHLFREAFQFFRMGYASALAWILFIIVLALTLVQLYLSKKWVHYEHS